MRLNNKGNKKKIMTWRDNRSLKSGLEWRELRDLKEEEN